MIKFIDELPESRNNVQKRKRELVEFADALRANPGRWAEYPGPIAAASVYARCNQIRNGSLASFPTKGEFEAAVRERRLYVRAVKKGKR